MSKVEKNATVEVKVVKVDDEGGEFHTQVDWKVDLQKCFPWYMLLKQVFLGRKEKEAARGEESQ